MSKKCLNCGAELKEGIRFCPVCGEKIEVNPLSSLPIETSDKDELDQSSNIFCPQCGAALSSDAKFCDVCGTSLIIEEQEDETKFYEFRTSKSIRSMRTYVSKVTLSGKSVKVENYMKGARKKQPTNTYDFQYSQIAEIKTGLKPVIGPMDIVRFLCGFILLLEPEYGIAGFIAGEAFFYWYSLLKAIKIKLKDGNTVPVYYKWNSEIKELLSELENRKIN